MLYCGSLRRLDCLVVRPITNWFVEGIKSVLTWPTIILWIQNIDSYSHSLMKERILLLYKVLVGVKRGLKKINFTTLFCNRCNCILSSTEQPDQTGKQ
jgi:hypothetical protein